MCLVVVLFLLFGAFHTAKATHLRAGEITYRHISGKRYEITVTTYAISPINVPVITNTDDPVITVSFGDGTSQDVPRSNVVDRPQGIRNLIVRINTYTVQHIFPGPGQFLISVSQSDRNGGVINIPNSITTDFFIESELIINPFLGDAGLVNRSPILLNPPLDEACLNRRYIHNPVAFDPDGDSLTYRIIACRQENGAAISGYRYPNEVIPGATNVFSIDRFTGDMVWESPKQAGEYNVAFIIEEFREGRKVGSVVRDMQINVYACSNQPPVIDPLIDTCVVAGDLFQFPIRATDPNPADNISLAAVGLPFTLQPGPANLFVTSLGNPVEGYVEWGTQCNAVSKSKYQLSIKAQDNSEEVILSDIENAYVQVNGPAPQLDTAIPQGNAVLVTWFPYVCAAEAVRFDLYRSNGSLGYQPGYCETGIPGNLGYTKVHSTSSIQDTFYLDNSLSFSAEFCYRLVAVFPDGAESIVSNEICAIARRDIPVLTQVTIDQTDVAVGSDTVIWALPIDLDTITQYPGPYEYRVYRETGINQASTLIHTTPTSPSLAQTDTVFQDIGINTQDTGYTYRVELWSNGQQVGTSSNASSVFLTTQPSDRLITLNLNLQVPWTNQSTDVYRLNDATGVYDFIGSTTKNFYNDSNLVNGQEYCYYVVTSGSYFNPTVRKPLINYSQITCEVPIDRTPPCLPAIEYEASCEENRFNMVWADTNEFCTSDLETYNLYYSPTRDGEMKILQQFDDNSFTFSLVDAPNIVGCYALSVTDTIGNESSLSNKFCVDNCALYELPNVFTPNEDGINDVFEPFPYKGIASVVVKVYNRWGVLLFETEDPEIQWDGTVEGQPVADGTYFYTADVILYTLDGEITEKKNGNITVIRNGEKFINNEGN